MYQLKIHRQVIKKLKKLSPKEYHQIIKAIKNLSQNPLNPQVKRLSGKHQGSYRLRIGGWRLLFTKDEKKKIIFLLYFGPRGDIY